MMAEQNWLTEGNPVSHFAGLVQGGVCLIACVIGPGSVSLDSGFSFLLVINPADRRLFIGRVIALGVFCRERKTWLAPLRIGTDNLAGVSHLFQDAVNGVALWIGLGIESGEPECGTQRVNTDLSGLLKMSNHLRSKRRGNLLDRLCCFGGIVARKSVGGRSVVMVCEPELPIRHSRGGCLRVAVEAS